MLNERKLQTEIQLRPTFSSSIFGVFENKSTKNFFFPISPWRESVVKCDEGCKVEFQ